MHTVIHVTTQQTHVSEHHRTPVLLHMMTTYIYMYTLLSLGVTSDHESFHRVQDVVGEACAQVSAS